MVPALTYQKGVLQLIDQRKLPGSEVWQSCKRLEDVAKAIKDMVVRGAPAIGCTAAYGMAVDAANHGHLATWSDYRVRFSEAINILAQTRPTAVNLFYALNKMQDLSREFTAKTSMSAVTERVEACAENINADDLKTCQAIGDHGASLAGPKPLRVLTHCNAGALATAGYGTALGVIRSLHKQNRLQSVYADETRPYLQGSRLTAYELECEKIPYKIITDSTAAYLMQQGEIDWVIVGADRIAMNGDTANKIGTYSLAVNCQHHAVKFMVAAPLSTIDQDLPDGRQIPVEERSATEITHLQGRRIAPPGAKVYNPSFDVTPHALISAIVTENGIAEPPFSSSLRSLFNQRSIES